MKDEIEDLIKRGYLGRYVRNRNQNRSIEVAVPRLTAPKMITDEMELPNQQPTDGSVGMIHHQTYYEDDRMAKRLRRSINFPDDDLQDVQMPHDDPVVISTIIANYDVRRILIDNGSFTEVLLYDAFIKINLPTDRLRRTHMPLTGFGENSVGVEEEITLPVTLGAMPK